METVRMKIYVDANPAIESGNDKYGDTIAAVLVDKLTEKQRSALLSCPIRVLKNSELGHDGEYFDPYTLTDGSITTLRRWLPLVADASLESMQKILTVRPTAVKVVAAKKAKEKKEEHARRVETMVKWARQCLDHELSDWWRLHWENGRAVSPLQTDPVTRPLYYDLDLLSSDLRSDVEHTRMYALAAAKQRLGEIERERVNAEKEKAAAAERKAAQIATFVAEHGTESMQARQKLGLLPESEAVDMIRDATYDALSAFPRFTRILMRDLDHDIDCMAKPCDMECESFTAKSLTAEQFAVYEQIAERAPKAAELSPLVHTCQCPDCGAKAERYSVQVAITVGELGFTREYAL